MSKPCTPFPAHVRNQFAVFRNQPTLAFLDSAASAQKPDMVLDAVRAFEEGSYANIHRGLYALSQAATQAYEDARVTMQKFVNATKSESIIFTRNSTEGINLVAQTWAKANLKHGDAIMVTRLEHHANLVPWQLLAAEKGLEIVVAECDALGHVTLADIQAAWTPRVKLLAMTRMSNALGTVPPMAEAIAFARNNGAKVLVDASQSAVHSPTDVRALGCDFLVFTGHKLYGPAGIGVLYVKPELLADMPPYQGGGDMIERVVLPMGTTFAEAPARWEAGTPNITGAVGLAAAIRFVESLGGWCASMDEEAKLAATAREELLKLGATIVGPRVSEAPIISFNLPNAHPHDVATILDQCGVAVRSGHHCCMPLMEKLSIAGTVRASFACYNTIADVEALVRAVAKAGKMLA
ncbi:MAG: cysteine desulfurase [Alphaproteobacteria bacterium]